ncbi:MAG: hypothetical protein ACO1TE_07415 [Prosthecobacter sp.]
MPALKNLQHEEFAQKVALGERPSKAYAELHPHILYNSAKCCASRLVHQAPVQERIAELRAEVVEHIKHENFLAYKEKRRFLARVVRSNGRRPNPEDGDLIQGVKHDRFGNEVLMLPDKLAALRLDNDLAADGAQAGAQKELQIHVRKL